LEDEQETKEGVQVEEETYIDEDETNVPEEQKVEQQENMWLQRKQQSRDKNLRRRAPIEDKSRG